MHGCNVNKTNISVKYIFLELVVGSELFFVIIFINKNKIKMQRPNFQLIEEAKNDFRYIGMYRLDDMVTSIVITKLTSIS